MTVVRSLPSWERGLKFDCYDDIPTELVVAPFVGAWIEIHYSIKYPVSLFPSLPSWERGLKWQYRPYLAYLPKSRSLRGSVD